MNQKDSVCVLPQMGSCFWLCATCRIYQKGNEYRIQNSHSETLTQHPPALWWKHHITSWNHILRWGERLKEVEDDKQEILCLISYLFAMWWQGRSNFNPAKMTALAWNLWDSLIIWARKSEAGPVFFPHIKWMNEWGKEYNTKRSHFMEIQKIHGFSSLPCVPLLLLLCTCWFSVTFFSKGFSISAMHASCQMSPRPREIPAEPCGCWDRAPSGTVALRSNENLWRS